jgi:predicted TIM-barrel fold metal-dependent hydrolase
MWDAKEELSRFLEMGLSQKEKENILYKNAEKLLNL